MVLNDFIVPNLKQAENYGIPVFPCILWCF